MNQPQKSYELLSPAGSLEKLRFAIAYGADAVYLGAKSFSLREGANNFTVEELSQAIQIAHRLDKKVYLASNIFYHDCHFDEFREFLKEIESVPIDGIILSDIGALHYVRERYPNLSVHISTQANTTNTESVRFYEKLGVRRIVLARELSLDEIKRIRDAVTLQLETFVHGAMCIAYSGRCLLSNYLTNRANYRSEEKLGDMKREKTRDANLGDCAQSCRWQYQLLEYSRPNEYLPIVSEEHGTAILSSKDLNLSANLSDLMDVGIDSFKIEGRIKSLYYVANVSRVYRHCLDSLQNGRTPDSAVLNELETISHREYSTGFYYGENRAIAPTKDNQYQKEYTFLGHILERLGEDTYLVRAMNQIREKMPIEAIHPNGQNSLLKHYTLVREDGMSGVSVDKVQPNERFIMKTETPLDCYDILRVNDGWDVGKILPYKG